MASTSNKNGGRRKPTGRGSNLAEWKKDFVAAARKAGSTATALKHICEKGADAHVVLELLYHHVKGNYGFGQDDRAWKAFRGQIKRVQSVQLALAEDLKKLARLKIFSLGPIPKVFLAREDGRFLWEKEIPSDKPAAQWLASPLTELQTVMQYMTPYIEIGDVTWRFRDFKDLNLVLLSIYLRCATREHQYHDKEVSLLLHTALEIEGRSWRSVENSAAAFAQKRRRFAVQQEQLERLVEMRRLGGNRQLDVKTARAFQRRWLYGDLVAMVSDFLGVVKSGKAQEFNGSLLEFINSCFVDELNSEIRMSSGQR